LLYDWHAGFECKPCQQVAADAVDCTDARLSDGGGQVVPAFEDEVRADPLSKLRGRGFGKRRRQDAGRAYPAVDQHIVQQFGEAIGLAAAGACADEAKRPAHASASQPASVRQAL
jgi:hypothetical protein